jgi:hypothetical protein
MVLTVCPHTWLVWRLQLKKVLIMHHSQTPCPLPALHSKYSPQHPGITPSIYVRTRYPRRRFTFVQNRQNYGSLYSNFNVFRQETRWHEGLDWMAACFARIQFPLNSTLNQIAPSYLNRAIISKDVFANLTSWFNSAFWWQNSNIYLFLWVYFWIKSRYNPSKYISLRNRPNIRIVISHV